MNEASVLKLLMNVRLFDHWYPLPAVTGGRRTAGFTDQPQGNMRYGGPPATVNGIFEVCEKQVVNPYGSPGFNLRTTVRMFMNRGTWPSGSAGECYQGLEIGSFGCVPPWQTTYAAQGQQAVIQFRHDDILERFELCIWDGDLLTAPAIIPCGTQWAWEIDGKHADMRLEWFPDVTTPANSVVEAYVNGLLLHRLVGGRLTGLVGQDFYFNWTGGYFATRGSDISNGAVGDCGFGGGYIYTPFEWTP